LNLVNLKSLLLEITNYFFKYPKPLDFHPETSLALLSIKSQIRSFGLVSLLAFITQSPTSPNAVATIKGRLNGIFLFFLFYEMALLSHSWR
jgi:hypothetical protein